MAAVERRNATETSDPKTGKRTGPRYLIEPVVPDPARLADQKLRLSDRVRNKELHAFLEIGANVIHPVATTRKARSPTTPKMRRWTMSAGGWESRSTANFAPAARRCRN